MFGFGGFDFFGKFMRVFMCSTKQFLVGSKWSTCFSWKCVVSSSKGLDVVSSLISGTRVLARGNRVFLEYTN